jgi:hypothetical protein
MQLATAATDLYRQDSIGRWIQFCADNLVLLVLLVLVLLLLACRASGWEAAPAVWPWLVAYAAHCDNLQQLGNGYGSIG